MSQTIEIKVPDIGNYHGVDVIEVLVQPGQQIGKDSALLTLETDKATMEVPSSHAGMVKEVRIKVGDKVSQGDVVCLLEVSEAGAAEVAAKPAPAAAVAAPAATPAAEPAPAPVVATPAPLVTAPSSAPVKVDEASFRTAHASPSVRKFARELGVDLGAVSGSGPKGRITQTDVQAFVKAALGGLSSRPTGQYQSGTGLDLLPWPQIDFSQFGPVESKPRSRIQKLSGANLARNWVMIPHVTQFDEADITELEAFRKQMGDELAGQGVKLTPLAFLIKACVAALKQFPNFNASLDGDNLVLKQYYHIGFAADTPNGLVVPVLKNADQKSLTQIARETGELAAKARDGKLGAADMQGGSFTISSLGGIGGTAFTPIINAPEVAILGVSKAAIKPVWNGEEFVPRQMLPLSLSYDHRVIDGAAAARFTAYLAKLLGDIRRLML
jgi:pyruvate dehydrogenase E2 component (dihydrolipoamide acetyltransferase)